MNAGRKDEYLRIEHVCKTFGSGAAQSEVDKMRARNPEEGLAGVSPRFVINALSGAIIQSQAKSLTTMDVLIALKDAIESDVRIDGKKKRKWVDFLVQVRKDFYNRWVKEDVHKALFVSFEQEAQELLDKYLDEVEATLDNRTIRDPITSEDRKPDERFLRSVEEKIRISESGKLSFRQEVVRKAMGAYKRGEKFTLDSHAPLHDAVEQYLFEQRRDVLRLVSSSARPDDETRQKISVVEKRLVDEYGYDTHSAREALNYVVFIPWSTGTMIVLSALGWPFTYSALESVTLWTTWSARSTWVASQPESTTPTVTPLPVNPAARTAAVPIASDDLVSSSSMG